ncbi:MAG TPA: DUF1579 domain-containing protein [Planctomycetota bacterium]|nr:DUF1579 domain-containing protein [Planctomycetota bacterium]
MRSTVLIALLALSFCIHAADNPQQDPKAMAAMMEKFAPGKEHEALAKLAGKYDVTVKMWMEPGKDPVESKAEAEFTMELKGRYLKQTFKGTMMGQPFTGVGYDGFDRASNKYTATWMDDFSTTMMYMTGTSKDGGKTVEYTGEQTCPMTGQMIKTRTVHKTVDDDTFTFEMYQTHDGKEMKGMELTYKRKK